LDQEIENLRKSSFSAAIRKKANVSKVKEKPKVLLANLPWQKKENVG